MALACPQFAPQSFAGLVPEEPTSSPGRSLPKSEAPAHHQPPSAEPQGRRPHRRFPGTGAPQQCSGQFELTHASDRDIHHPASVQHLQNPPVESVATSERGARVITSTMELLDSTTKRWLLIVARSVEKLVRPEVSMFAMLRAGTDMLNRYPHASMCHVVPLHNASSSAGRGVTAKRERGQLASESGHTNMTVL